MVTWKPKLDQSHYRRKKESGFCRIKIHRNSQKFDFVTFCCRIVYDRVPSHRTLAVFALSAIWHGFYPGYYMAFFTCGLMVEAARKVCRLHMHIIITACTMRNVSSTQTKDGAY